LVLLFTTTIKTTNINKEVTQFLDVLNHPFRAEIEALRHIILSVNKGIKENIK
jgi:hypothetical protein